MRCDLHVAALTAGRAVPSARFRVGQHVAGLAELGIALSWHPAPIAKYPPVATWKRPFWLAGTIAGRIPSVIASRRADVVLLGRELVSTLLTLEPILKRPRVLDVDDAIWLTQKYHGIEKLAREVDAVFAGNDYLAEWFARECRDVVVIPTAVDTSRFVPRPSRDSDRVVIGWSGTAANLASLEPVWPALEAVALRHPEVRIRIVCDKRPQTPGSISDRIDFVPWHPSVEVRSIQEMDVGIMPMPASPWSLGKCSYKMLLYLACGVPAVVSPIGMNGQVLAMGEVGLGARTSGDWEEALEVLVGDASFRNRLGRAGRELVVARFSLEHVGGMLASNLRRVA